MAIMVGTGRGAAHGVLIRNAEALERLEKVDTLVVDKTGTLTEGKPRARRRSTAVAPFTERDVLRLAAGLEQASEHPLAAAIVAGARERGIALRPTSQAFESVTGTGVSGRVDGRERRCSATRRCSPSASIDATCARRATPRRSAPTGRP